VSEVNQSLCPITIVIAEDDPDDQLLAREALEESRIANTVHFVNDGQELLDFLRHAGQYARLAPPRPDLILLDLNMPRMDGREALAVIKADSDLRSIPVVILTTSKAEEEIVRAYNLGANSFIVKPVSFEGLVYAVRVLTEYWFTIVRLPKSDGTAA
jgi:CheY-like chemotaxis protein